LSFLYLNCKKKLLAWATCPADMRELVETGKLAGEEE
jgi:hypothetical protein